MNNLRNHVQLIGRVGQSPELQTINADKKVLRISLATNEYFKNAAGERQQITDWHNLVAWGKLAEALAKSIDKGQEIAISGRLKHRAWEDKAGNKRTKAEIVISNYMVFESSPQTA